MWWSKTLSNLVTTVSSLWEVVVLCGVRLLETKPLWHMTKLLEALLGWKTRAKQIDYIKYGN